MLLLGVGGAEAVAAIRLHPQAVVGEVLTPAVRAPILVLGPVAGARVEVPADVFVGRAADSHQPLLSGLASRVATLTLSLRKGVLKVREGLAVGADPGDLVEDRWRGVPEAVGPEAPLELLLKLLVVQGGLRPHCLLAVVVRDPLKEGADDGRL